MPSRSPLIAASVALLVAGGWLWLARVPTAYADSIVEDPVPAGASCPAEAGPPPAAGEHCIPLPVDLVYNNHASDEGGELTCGQALFMQVQLREGIAEYDAAWSRPKPGAPAPTPWIFTATGGPHGSGSGPYSEEAYSTTALTVANTGVNIDEYRVPRGFGAWFVSAGGGPGACEDEPGVAVAWGWTSETTIEGDVVSNRGVPLPDAVVDISGPTSVRVKTNVAGSYGPVLVRAGGYTVSARFPIDRSDIRLYASVCTGHRVRDSCSARLSSKGKLVASFYLVPQLELKLDPDRTSGDGRGSSEVTIRLTANGQPVAGHGVELLMGPRGYRTPPLETADEREHVFRELQGVYPLLGCDGDGPVLFGRIGHGLETNARGEIDFRLFVGTQQGILGSPLGVNASDLYDSTPIPGLPRVSADITVAEHTFGTIPTPQDLRLLARRHPPPLLGSADGSDQEALLEWLTSGGLTAEFAAGENHDWVVFGDYLSSQATWRVLTVAGARAIFASAALPAQLPTVSELGPFVDVGVERSFLWGEGIYPNTETEDGRVALACDDLLQRRQMSE